MTSSSSAVGESERKPLPPSSSLLFWAIPLKAWSLRREEEEELGVAMAEGTKVGWRIERETLVVSTRHGSSLTEAGEGEMVAVVGLLREGGWYAEETPTTVVMDAIFEC